MPLPSDLNARRYYRVAFQRRNESLLLLSKVGLPAAAIYVGGYAAECILKALLLVVTPAGERRQTARLLKVDYGHNLRRLRVALIERGVDLPRDVAKELILLGTWSPEMRYDPGPGDAATAERFLAALAVVIDWADGRM